VSICCTFRNPFFSEGPFEVASFEHFSFKRPFSMAAMIVFTLKCPSEGNVSHLECTVDHLKASFRSEMSSY